MVGERYSAFDYFAGEGRNRQNAVEQSRHIANSCGQEARQPSVGASLRGCLKPSGSASRLVMVVIIARWTMASWWSGLVS